MFVKVAKALWSFGGQEFEVLEFVVEFLFSDGFDDVAFTALAECG